MYICLKTKRLWLTVLLVLALLVCLTGCSGTGTEAPADEAPGQPAEAMPNETPDVPGPATPEPAKPAEPLALPLDLEDGRLTLNSLFVYSGFNPDFGFETSDNIGAVELVNSSGTYLSQITMTVTLSDGSVLCFTAWDIPVGQTIWIFAQDNAPYNESADGLSVDCEAQFLPGDPMMSDQLSVETDGVTVTLTNLSDQELPALEVVCHCLFSDACFGGTAYTYITGPIAPGGNASIAAEDCFLGEALPVRVAPAE